MIVFLTGNYHFFCLPVETVRKRVSRLLIKIKVIILNLDKKRRTKVLCMEDLIPDSEKRKELLCRLYNNDSLSGKGSIFTDMLQSIINAVATIIFSVVFCQIDFTFDEPFVLLNCLKFQ